MSLLEVDERINKRLRSAIPVLPEQDARVKVNVGGTIFVTLRSTLVENCTYFQSQSSFQQHSSNDAGAEEIFIDQDPEYFKPLLSYMRQGSIHISELSKDKSILDLAEYLGMERLVKAAILIMARNAGLVKSGMSVEEILAAFHSSIATNLRDMTKEQFNQLLFCPPRERMEYATLYTHIPEYDYTFNGKARVNAPPYRAGLRTMVDGLDQRPARERFDRSGDKGGFFLPIFALNWLGRQGYELSPSDVQKYDDKDHRDKDRWNFNEEEWEQPLPSHVGELVEEMLFQRPVAEPSEEEKSLLSVIGGVNVERSLKEYATLNMAIGMRSDVFVQCASTDTHTICRLNKTKAKSSVRLHFPDMAQAMDWMNQNEFHTQEPELEQMLCRSQKRAKDDFFGPTLVFSKPLLNEDQSPNVSNLQRTRVVIAFKNLVKRDRVTGRWEETESEDETDGDNLF